jgi:hypothetical protein
MSRRIKSLQLRLMVELAALFFVASCLAVGGLIYSASLTAGSLADRELGLRAEDLARYVSPDENRKLRLSLPPPLKQAYSAAAQQSLFAIRDKDGHIVEASTPEIGAMIARWPQADAEPSYFRLRKFGRLERDYSGVSVRLDSGALSTCLELCEVPVELGPPVRHPSRRLRAIPKENLMGQIDEGTQARGHVAASWIIEAISGIRGRPLA